MADRYSVGSPIGQGRSTVYRGQDTVLQRAVALKEVKLAAGQETHDRVRARARREAHAAARLHSPSVVDIFDIVEDDGSLWLVMELVEAPNLREVVRDEGPLPHQRAAEIGRDVLDALAAAHAAGVVHRDVKPANVLVRADAPAKLADFGVATLRDETRVTATGMVLGSPAYMAPEQARGEGAGPAADLWALGATLYYAIEGAAPFAGDTAIATASAVVHGEPRPQQRPGPLSRIVTQLLVKDPLERPTVGEVHTALLAAARQRTAVAPTEAAAPTDRAPAVPPPAASPPRPASTATTATTAGRAPGRADSEAVRRRRQLTGGLLVLAVLALAAWAVWGGGNGDDDPAARPADSTEAPADDASASTAPTTAAPADDTTTTTPSTTAAAGAPVVPAGWTVYDSPDGAYRIAYPPGWEVVPAGGPRVDFRDPATGAYMRVDWTDSPRPDPVADWQQQAGRFAGSHDGYEEISIAPASYRNYNAALWEFRYATGGTTLHAANLGFVTGNRGYALLFQSPEADWAASQSVADSFRQAFQPLAG